MRRGSSGMSISKSLKYLSSNTQNDLEIVTASGPLTGTFDPKLVTLSPTTVTWILDDGTTYVTTGTIHEISHTFATLANHLVIVRVAAGLSAVTLIQCNTDNILVTRDISKLTGLTTWFMFENALHEYSLSDLSKILLNISVGTTRAHGDIYDLGRVYTSLKCSGPRVFGSLSSIAPTCLVAWLTGTKIKPGTISHAVVLNDLHIYDTGMNTAEIDQVVNDIYLHRAVFTNAAPDLNFNTGVSRPSGGYTDPEVTPGDTASNTDWSWNGVYHVPLTPMAKIWYLTYGPDHGTDTFNHWTIEFPTVFWNIVAEGDSFTSGGVGGATSWVTLLQTLLGTTSYKTYNCALGGHTLYADIIPAAANTIDIYAWNQKNVAVLMAGVNDANAGRTAAQIHADTRKWCIDRQAIGFKVILCSIPIQYSGTQAQEDIRVAANTLIAADCAGYTDAYIDLDVSDVYVGHDYATGRNETYIQADGLHPTMAAETVFRDLINAQIAALTW